MRRPRRNHTAAFKAKVAIAALKGDETLAALAEKFDIIRIKSRSGRRSCWRTPRAFRDGCRETGGDPGPERLAAKIGQQALEIDFLAVALGRIGDASAKK